MTEEHWQNRTGLLIGREKLDILASKHVLIAGLGGVGGFAAEAVCRAGIGSMTIADHDTVHPGNRNRQLLALKSTEGKNKAELMAARLLDINPDLHLTVVSRYLKEDTMAEVLEVPFDYVIDAIDTLSPKLFLIVHCLQKKYPVVSSLGSGGRLDPLEVRIGDISESNHCHLGRMLRKRLHRRGIYTGFKVIYSPEPVDREGIILISGEANKKTTVGTISYMPAIFGLYAASVVIRDLAGLRNSVE